MILKGMDETRWIRLLILPILTIASKILIIKCKNGKFSNWKSYFSIGTCGMYVQGRVSVYNFANKVAQYESSSSKGEQWGELDLHK